MAGVDKEFNLLCKTIKSKGKEYENKRRGVKRLQIPSFTFKHDFSEGFPAITNKQLPFKFIKGELIWFLRGDTNVKYLIDNGISIWNKDAYNLYIKVASGNHGKEANNIYHDNGDDTLRMYSFEEFVNVIDKCPNISHLKANCSYGDYTIGDVGRNYSAQWREFQGDAVVMNSSNSGFIYERHDQIAELIEEMRKDIMSSRLIVNAWNPAELDKTALPPCHDKFQVIGVPLTMLDRMYIVRKQFPEEQIGTQETVPEFLTRLNIQEFGFELHWNQRSVDTFLGLPFNVASYALLAKILEEITGFPSLGVEGALKCVHFYDNQYEAVDLMLSRDIDQHMNCELVFSESFKLDCKNLKEGKISLDDFLSVMDLSCFKLKGYTSDEAITVEMLAPKSI